MLQACLLAADAALVAVTRISGIVLGVFLSLIMSVIIFPKSASHQAGLTCMCWTHTVVAVWCMSCPMCVLALQSLLQVCRLQHGAGPAAHGCACLHGGMPLHQLRSNATAGAQAVWCCWCRPLTTWPLPCARWLT